MRITALAAVLALSLAACSLPEVSSATDSAAPVAPVADSMLAVLDPRLAHLEDLVDGVHRGIEAIRETRLARGVPEEEDLSLSEWLAILGTSVGSVLAGGLALNRRRSETRRQELKQLENRIARAEGIARMEGRDPRRPPST